MASDRAPTVVASSAFTRPCPWVTPILQPSSLRGHHDEVLMHQTDMGGDRAILMAYVGVMGLGAAYALPALDIVCTGLYTREESIVAA